MQRFTGNSKIKLCQKSWYISLKVTQGQQGQFPSQFQNSFRNIHTAWCLTGQFRCKLIPSARRSNWGPWQYKLSWWRHHMEHFPCNCPFVRGIHRSPVYSRHKGQWRGALMLSLICVWINDWVNNCEAGDLRHYRAHYDVIVVSI